MPAPRWRAQGVPAARITAARRAHLRYDGTDTAVIVPVGPLAGMLEAFESEYTRRFSFLMRDKTIVVEAVSVEVTGTQENLGSADPGRDPPKPPAHGEAPRPASPLGVKMFAAGAWADVDLLPRNKPRGPGRPPAARPSSPRSWPPPWSNPAGRPP